MSGLADILLGNILLGERADAPTTLKQNLQGLDFKTRKKTILLPGQYLFVEFDSTDPKMSIVVNLKSKELFLVDSSQFKKAK